MDPRLLHPSPSTVFTVSTNRCLPIRHAPIGHKNQALRDDAIACSIGFLHQADVLAFSSTARPLPATAIAIATVQLSCKSEYALLALFELAQHYNTGEPLQIKQLATQQDIPERYLEQLLATLRRCGLVRSQRGAKGGYLLGREPWTITLLEAIDAIEGSDSATKRKGNSAQAANTPERTLLHETWTEARSAAEAVLKKYTLQDLCDLRAQRQRANVMYYI